MNPKAKGSKFERDVCKALSLWISEGQRQDLFWRSAMSGGRATVAHKNSAALLRAQCGDICAVDPLGNVLTDDLYFECKHLKQLSFDGLVKSNRGQGSLIQIWRETQKQSARYDKFPVLICRQNGYPTLFCGDKRTVDNFLPKLIPLIASPLYDLYAVLLENLLRSPPPKLRAVR